jgi:histone demethylase JARID1
MLHHLDVPVTGVVVPWLYVGMAFSAFCWHAEDHYLYSINYLHHGLGPKHWYGLPGAAGDAFEALVRESYPELVARNPDLMLQLVTMVDPRWVADRGLPVYTTKQRPGPGLKI